MKTLLVIGAGAAGLFLLWKATQLGTVPQPAAAAVAATPAPPAPQWVSPLLHGGFSIGAVAATAGHMLKTSEGLKFVDNPILEGASVVVPKGKATIATNAVLDPGSVFTNTGHGTIGSVVSAIANPGGSALRKVISWL
jgi:hypothetical protein